VAVRRTLLAGLAITLGGCGTVADPTSWLASADVVEPSELVEMVNETEPQFVWETDVGVGTDERDLNLQPKVVGNTVYVADAEGRVVALDRASGRARWSVDLDLPVAGGPGAGEGLVLIGTSDADVVALDAGDGSERWRQRVSSEVLSVPAIANGVVVVHTIDGKLFGLEATTGNERWQYAREVPVLSLRGVASPVVVGGVVYVGLAGGRLITLRADNGGVLWEATVTVPGGRSELERIADVDGEPLVAGGGVFVATFQGEVAAVQQRTGQVAWRRPMSVYSRLAADAIGIYVSDADGDVWGLDPSSGAVRWRQEALKYRRLSDVAVLDGLVVVGDFEGYLHWLDHEDGHLVARTRVGSEPVRRGLQVVDDTLYVLGDGGDLAAVRLPAAR
jgi:outer membrane protein assembly factor BamB